ncbi:type IV secretion system protein VirD2 [Vibrio splendidus]|uniref:Type IV secretion system protein VirD2 n=1 Tax=Vibrio splendidus TaxID=29497 RepID=A0A2T5EAP9_VIBSP|nr:relaxase/mobilization nuclease domain-containing protein [Vibrio splendidus]PTP16407.1 type IV secretion system protein VirD2 [Vibrio splendidus]
MIFTKLEFKRTKQTIKDAAHLVEYGAKQKDADNLVQYGSGNSKDHASANEGHSFFICANEIDSIPVRIGELATGADWSDAISELQSSLKHNPNVTESFRHFVISLDEGEHLTDKQWKKAVKRTMDHLGYDSARYIAFRHSDTDSEHVHITVSSQCFLTNKVISDWQSVTNAQVIMRELEKELGLKELVSTQDMDRMQEYVADKQAPDTIKFVMRRLVNKAIHTLDKEASLVEFELALLNVGVTIHLKEDAAKGEFKGLIYVFSDYKIPASKLRSGNVFTLGQLVKNSVLAKDALSINAYKEEIAKEDVSQKIEWAVKQLEKVRRYAVERADEVKKELESYDKSQINRMMFTYHKNKAAQANSDYWLYHGKKIKDLLDKQVFHAIYEYEKGVYKAAGQVTNVFYMLLTILFEMSKRDGSYLQVTPIKKDHDEERELAEKCKKAEREFHLESSQRFNNKAFKKSNKVKNSELDI